MKAKHTLLIALIVNIIIRIPRMLLAQGSDGFTAIWEAQLILNGEYFSNGFNFLTIMGVVPFSGYPVGFLFILCFFLLIAGKNIMIATLLFDLVFIVIFVVSSYYLSKELEIKESLERIKFLEKMDKSLAKSELTEEDALLLGGKVKAAVSKRFAKS